METTDMIKTEGKGLRPKTNIFFYSPQVDKPENELIKSLEGLIPGKKVKIYRTKESLLTRLKKPLAQKPVLVLFIYGREDLDTFIAHKPVLNDIPKILILPERESAMIAKGHSLRPRFLSYYDNDLNEVKGVLKKMLSI
jgi:hypothetical protein